MNQKHARRWIAIDLAGVEYTVTALVAAELTPTDIDFLVEVIDKEIEAWGDPEGDLEALRRKLRGEEEMTS